MRKILSFILLILFFCFGLSACKNNQPINNSTNENSNITEPTDNSNATNDDTTTNTNDEVTEMKIIITVGDKTLHATLANNEATKKLYSMMPFTYSMMNLYGREMCYRMGNGALPDLTAEDIGYSIGDISYWPPAGSLVILYKQNGEVFEQVKIGHIDEDVSFFDGMPTTDITFSKDE